MKFTKNFKRVISLVCALAMVLSCMTVLFGMTVSAATVDVTLNNNGTVTTEALEAGAALPTPSSDIANNQFRGWYTDTTWTTKVETVPAEATTLYANWSTIKVTFDNWATYDSVSDDTRAELVDGAVRINFNQGNAKRNFIFPAYDVDTTTSYVFKEGKEYNITFDYKLVTALNHSAINRGLYYGYQVDGTATDTFNNTLIKQRHIFGAMNLMEEYETGTFTITAASTANIYLLLNNYSDTSVWFDNLYIEEVLPRIAVTLNNNGVITTEEIVEGGSLPTPTSDIEGNKFLGWYTDTTWATPVTTLTEGATYYAKWTTTVIDFSNLANINALSSSSSKGVSTIEGNKMARVNMNAAGAANTMLFPAYNAAEAGPYFFEAGKSYEISFTVSTELAATVWLMHRDGGLSGSPAWDKALEASPATAGRNTPGDFLLETTTIDVTSSTYYGVASKTNSNPNIFFIDDIIIKELAPTYEVTMNNNGTVTTENLEEGAALPTPESDIEGNEFLGWYTDITWATEVTEVPAEAIAVVAKWSKIKVSFQQFDNVAALSKNGAFRTSAAGKVVRADLNKTGNYSILVPAYDAAGAGAYQFEAGKNYRITFDFCAAQAATDVRIVKTTGVTYRASNGQGGYNYFGDLKNFINVGTVSNEGNAGKDSPTVFETLTVETGVLDAATYLGIGEGSYSQKVCYVGNFIIEEIKAEVKEGVIGTSIREESGAGESYKSAAIRFRGRVNAETIADAAKVGFIVVPNGYDVETYGLTAINKDTAAGTDITYVDEKNVDGYVDYQVLVFGLTKEGVEKDLCNLSLKVIFFYEDAEGVQHQIGEDYIKSFNDVANK